jgi:DNA-directed RNA polymerase specialized sigma24 family protein
MGGGRVSLRRLCMSRVFSMSPRREAETLADANYEVLKEVVLRSVRSRLLASGVRLDWLDLEEAYNQAWHGVCQVIVEGRRVENLPGLLVDISGKRAIDIYRQRNEAMFADADVEARVVECDLAERVDDRQKIDRLLERLRDRLSDVQRNAVALCLLHGYTRPEAARILDIEPAAFEKVMDRTTKKISGMIAAMDGRGCGDDEWARALRLFALGMTNEDSPDYGRVASHVRECASCERYVLALRGLAAVLPPLGLPLVPRGYSVGDLLACLHRLFARHGTVSAASAQSSSMAAAAGSTGTGSTVAGGGGGWALVSSGTAKLAAVAGAATVGVLSVHTFAIHRSVHHSRTTVSQSTAQGSGSALLGQVAGAGFKRASATEEQQARPIRRIGRADQRGSRVVERVPATGPGAVEAEFGVQEELQDASAPAHVTRTAAVAESARVSRPGRLQVDEPHEFSFEH